ncbi:MAG: Flp pilus assembly complex ATPase component TadA [Verrucomicrobia bacterium]|nr:Flp pilus assembly complex ATPase component TadA [Verrucomicrobiota bacterium]
MMTVGFSKPELSSAWQASFDLNCFLHLQVAGALGITEKDLRPLLARIFAAEAENPMTIWQQDSLIERYSNTLDLDLSAIFTNLIRDYGLTPFDPTLLRFSPNAVKIPPLAVPLLPVARTNDTVTIASYVPNLDLLLQEREFQTLNRFWGVPQLTSVWCEPEHLRLVLNRLTENFELGPCNIELTRRISNGGTSWINLDEVSPSEKVNHWFSPTLQRRYLACPVYCGRRRLTLAVAKLLAPNVKAEIEGTLRHRFTIQQMLADADALERFITTSETRAISASGILRTLTDTAQGNEKNERLEVIHADSLQSFNQRHRNDEQAVIKFVHSILYKGVELGASDIMFQEFPHRLRVRYKVDGDWFDEEGDFPGHVAKQVISRIKVISGLEIQYVRLPQDGTFPIKIGDQRYDFRVNTSYQAQGEQAVLRLQRDARSVKSLAELGVPANYIDVVNDLMESDHGLLILCGPTGSGKTTTIYSILRSIDSIKNNVLTAESPIEVSLENVSQTQVDDDGPYTYAMWARGILRQAPDVVMMGEIRDEESVEALMRLSSSGHRAISTLHTNTVCEVPNRLCLFRAQPFMVADSLKLAISQRLIKKLCPRCAIDESVPSEERLVRLGINPEWLAGATSVRRGRNCDFCRKTGVSGRKAIFEALIVDDEVKIAIQERAPALQLQRILERRGEASLFEKAVREAVAGIISLEEACKFRDVSSGLVTA